MELFTSYLNHQLSCWFSRIGHPLAVASNTLSQSWIGLSLFTYPPIPCLEKTLIKIMEDQVEEVIVIALSWPRRSWYHLLIQIVCEIPFRIPMSMGSPVTTPARQGCAHTDLETLQLLGWKLSGVPSRIKCFQMQLLLQASLSPMTPHVRCTMEDGNVSLAGVTKGIRFLFARL